MAVLHTLYGQLLVFLEVRWRVEILSMRLLGTATTTGVFEELG